MVLKTVRNELAQLVKDIVYGREIGKQSKIVWMSCTDVIALEHSR